MTRRERRIGQRHFDERCRLRVIVDEQDPDDARDPAARRLDVVA